MAQNRTHKVDKISKERLRSRPVCKINPKTRAATQKDLCPNCISVDLYSLLNDEDIELTHSTLAEAVKNVDCAFCQYVVKFSKEKYGDLDLKNQEMIRCSLLRLPLSFDPQHRKGDRMYYAEIQPTIDLRHRCSCFACGGTTCPKNIIQLDWHYSELDLLHIPPGISSNTRLPTLARKSFDKTFNREKLLKWLEESGVNEVQQPSSTNTDAMSLEKLIRASRFRVLDITSSKIVTVPYHVRYIALSYVWGNAQSGSSGTGVDESYGHAATARGIDAFIDIQRLPWTIQDTIELVRRIGERYLWVDALCIIQDDPDDKAAVIPEMGAIYGNAYLTVVAADGSHSNARLSRLVAGDAPEEWIPMVTRQGCFNLSCARPTMQTVIRRSNWNSRAWTLQERLLSKRCVLFTESGVFFDCPAFSASEAYALSSSANVAGALKLTGEDLFESFQLNQTSRFETYCSLLLEYTSKKLSHTGDRLDALTSVLKQLQPEITSSEHVDALSGLSYKDFVASLHWSGQSKRPKDKNPSLWHPSFQLRKMSRLETDTRRSRHLPSWSWCGWTDRVTLESMYFNPIDRKTPWVHTRNALPKPTIIDTANIICHTLHPPTDIQLELCKVTRPLCVILHLWVKT